MASKFIKYDDAAMKTLPTTHRVATLILGGGKGSRIYPLTKDRSKPAIPFGAKFRVIDIPISNCINSDLNKIFVLTQYNSRSLNKHIHNTYRFDHFNHNFVDVLAPEQRSDNADWYLGTADAVRKNLCHLDSYPECDTVLILSGDQIYRMDYRELFLKHIQQQADVTIATLPVTEDRVKDFGIMKIDTQGQNEQVVDFTEKTKDPDTINRFALSKNYLKKVGKSSDSRLFLASMGIYLFKRKVLENILNDCTDPDFGKQIIPKLIKQQKVTPFYFDGYWEDIGTIKSFHQSNMDLLGENPKFRLYDENAPIYTNPRFLHAAYIQDSQIKNCLITDGCTIKQCSLENCLIGLRSIINPGVEMKNTLMIGSDWYENGRNIYLEPNEHPMGIGEGSIIHNAILDKNVRIGKNVKIINHQHKKNFESKSPHYVIDDGIIVIPKNTYIPDNTVI